MIKNLVKNNIQLIILSFDQKRSKILEKDKRRGIKPNKIFCTNDQSFLKGMILQISLFEYIKY